MTEQGLPEFAAAQIVTIFGILRAGTQEQTTDTVWSLTGRDPYSFADFAQDHASLFTPPSIQQNEQEKAS